MLVPVLVGCVALLTGIATPAAADPAALPGLGLITPTSTLATSPADKRYRPLEPARLADTRGGPTVDCWGPKNLLGPGQSVDVQVAGRGGVPATGAGAVMLNVTAVTPTNRTWLAVWPTGGPRPGTSSVNTVAGDNRANAVLTKIGTDGKVSVYNSSGDTHLVVDVTGWFPEVSDFSALEPARLADTRGGATVDGGGPKTVLGPGQSVDVQVAGRGGVPATGAGAVMLNVTAVTPTNRTWLAVWPTGGPRPGTSSVNTVAGDNRANAVLTKIGTDGKVSVYNSSGDTHLVVDVTGWMADGYEGTPPATTTPANEWPQQPTDVQALSAGEAALWTLAGSKGQRLRFSAWEVSSIGLGSGFRLSVCRPNGTFLGVATGHGQIIANLHLVLPDDGEYKIELLNDYHLPRQAGSLKVAGLLPVDAGVWTGQPTDVPALGPMQAAQWTIKGKKGQQVPIFTRAAGYAFGDIWHGIEMLRPDGSRLRGESVYVAGLGSRWNVVLPEDGVYQFELLNSSVKPKPAGVYQVAGLLPVDSGIWTGQITGVPALGPRQTARWIFEGKRGQKIPFSALNVTDSAHSYRLTVYRPDGTRLDASFGYAPLEQGGLPAYLDLVMPDDGMYTIELSNESWTPRPAGTYEVSGLLPVAAGVWAGQSTGVPALGPMQAARWILVGRKGQEIPLSATRAPGTNTNYMLAVYSPSGTLLNTALANDRSRISLDVVIPENGSYTVELRNFSWTRTAANTFNVSG